MIKRNTINEGIISSNKQYEGDISVQLDQLEKTIEESNQDVEKMLE
ncbi:MAG: hypothetical protein ABIG10_01345 [bacterium]